MINAVTAYARAGIGVRGCSVQRGWLEGVERSYESVASELNRFEVENEGAAAFYVAWCSYVAPIQSIRAAEWLLSCVGSGMLDEGVATERLVQGGANPYVFGVDDRLGYPIKTHPGAHNKVNFFFRDVARDAKRAYPKQYAQWVEVSHVTKGMYNDQATGWLMWFMIVAKSHSELAVRALMHWDHTEWLKDLNVLIKGLGAAGTAAGPLFAELSVLGGRGVGDVDWAQDLAARCSVIAHEALAAKVDDVELEQALREVYAVEVGNEVQLSYCSAQEYFDDRWATIKSGGHSKSSEAYMTGRPTVVERDLTQRTSRRVYAESTKYNPLLVVKPGARLTPLKKLENGKTRPLYSTDTISYMHFDWAYRPVEKAWRNRRVMLNAEDTPATYKEAMGESGYVNLMIDWTDFNSAHKLSSLKMVDEIFLQYAPTALREWCVASWDNVVCVDPSGGADLVWVATLPSGHRGTSIYNSILNAAYCRCAIGPEFWQMKSKHTGDDSWFMQMGGVSIHLAVAGLIIHPVAPVSRGKQSIGSVNGEFKRVSYKPDLAVGYLSRAISAAVAGNWVSDVMQSPVLAVEVYAQLAWTLRERGFDDQAGLLFESTVVRRVPQLAASAHEFLLGGMSINSSPVLSTRVGDMYPAKFCELDLQPQYSSDPLPRAQKRKAYATEAYMAKHVNFELLAQAGVTPGLLRARSLEATYKRLQSEILGTRVAVSYAWAMGRLLCTNTIKPRRGLLSGVYPWEQLKSRLSVRALRIVLSASGYNPGCNPVLTAWGAQSYTCVVDGHLPYGIARSLGNLVPTSVIWWSDVVIRV